MNPRKFCDFRVVTNPSQLRKCVADSRLQQLDIISKDFVLARMQKNLVQLFQPAQIGFVCLDFAKLWMYRFYYQVMKPRYGDRVQVAFTDTDSLLMRFVFVISFLFFCY